MLYAVDGADREVDAQGHGKDDGGQKNGHQQLDEGKALFVRSFPGHGRLRLVFLSILP